MPIISRHPRANGQAERYVREIKAGLRRFAVGCPDGNWWDFLADIARGLRIIPVRATGYAPFVLVYKQQPVVTLPAALRAFTEEELADGGDDHVEVLQGVWADIMAEV